MVTHSNIYIYIYFIQPHLDYGEIIYDEPNNESFWNLIERDQYNAALAITGAIKGTSQLQIYNELSFETLKFRRWFGGCVYFIKSKLPKFLNIFMNYFPQNYILTTLVI